MISDKFYGLLDGMRIVFRGISMRRKPFKKYSGSVEEICRKIIDSCYNKKGFFMVSPGHFKQFYARDFGMFCEALIKLGYKKEVKSTIKYAMDAYIKAGRITTQIHPSGKPFDFPNHTPESLAYMTRSLIALNDKELTAFYKHFIIEQAEYVFKNDIDVKTGLLKKEKSFSSMKDHANRKSDCYNNCILGMLSNDLKILGIDNPLTNYDYSDLLMKNFWQGDFFNDDLSGQILLSGDANTFPFWTGVIKDKIIFDKVLKSIQKKGLDNPWPLKYTVTKDIPNNLSIYDNIATGYERDTIWMHLGLCFVKSVQKFDSKTFKKYIKQYEELVLKHKNFLELYFANGKPYKVSLYCAEESIIWVAGFLDMYLNQ